MSRVASVFLSAIIVLVLRGSSAAVLTDHLQCFSIKDPQAKQTYTATLTPSDNAYPVAPGCTVKVPAKLLCIDVEKSAVTPAPPGAGPGSQAQKYLCYKVKCPKLKQLVPVEDQFGSRTVKINSSNLVCAPFPAPTTTTTVVTTTTSTTIPGSCAQDADCPSYPNAIGICVGGMCVPQCNAGYANCNNATPDGCEVSLMSDPNNCGGCGTTCSPNNIAGGPTCANGVCNGPCSAGYADCNGSKQLDGCEINITNSATNCGGCGMVCPSHQNSVPTCTNITCGFSCLTGYSNCDNLTANGCEVNTASDPTNCGACGVVCPIAAPNCVSSSCSP